MQVRSSNERYGNLRSACDALMERLQAARDKQRDYDDALYTAQSQIMSAEATARQVNALRTNEQKKWVLRDGRKFDST